MDTPSAVQVRIRCAYVELKVVRPDAEDLRDCFCLSCELLRKVESSSLGPERMQRKKSWSSSWEVCPV